MTSLGEANVVPIALVLDGRTGYTLWAAPWVEDGEEWQAFLGAGSTVFVFEGLDDLAGFLGSGAETDLSDHPSWAVLQTLPAAQLTPETDYVFDLDEVPGLTEGDPSDEVVMRVGDTVDMVQRIAECCDNGALLNLLDSPEFAALLDEEAIFEPDESDEPDESNEPDEDQHTDATDELAEGSPVRDDLDDTDDTDDLDEDEDNPWAEIGEIVRASWPLVTARVNECLRWFAIGQQPERVTRESGDSAAPEAQADGAAEDGTGDGTDEKAAQVRE
ncbi:MAG TPA: hypothetical protein VFX70_14650 [Mycobacteriales bacterium]|nr:hypothetical protein [Mycobacteriales bacterium]